MQSAWYVNCTPKGSSYSYLFSFFLLGTLNVVSLLINFGRKEGKKGRRKTMPRVTEASFSSSRCLLPPKQSPNSSLSLPCFAHADAACRPPDFLPLDHEEFTNVP